MAYNNNNRRNVSTNIKTLYGDTASLSMSYWNELISLKMNPCNGTNADGIRQYDRNRSFSTALTAQKVRALVDLIDSEIIPVMKEVAEGKALEQSVNVAVQNGAKKAMMIVQYAKDDMGRPCVYLIGYTTTNDDGTCASQNMYIYKFGKTAITKNYNPNTGKGDTVYVDSEFEFFYNVLKNHVNVFGTASHSNAYFNSWSNDNNGGNQQGNGGMMGGYNSNQNSGSMGMDPDSMPF